MCPSLEIPWTIAYWAPLSSGEKTGVGCHFLLQRIFLTQESNLGLLHCRQILYRLSYEGSGKQQMSYIDRKRSLDSSTLSQCTHSLTTSTQLAACPLPVSFKKRHSGTSLALQWLRIYLPMQGSQVRSPSWGTKIPHAWGQLSPNVCNTC